MNITNNDDDKSYNDKINIDEYNRYTNEMNTDSEGGKVMKVIMMMMTIMIMIATQI